MARKENLTETLYRLEPGESRVFSVPHDKLKRTLRTTAWRLGRDEERKYVCREVADGYYVGRIA